MDLKLSTDALRPPARDTIFENGISHPDIFIWDAWSLKKDNDIYLYTLGTPRDIYKNGGIDIQTQRDHVPHHHRLFISSDQGKSWKDEGPVFWPRLGEDKFDNRSVWTGSTIAYQGKLVNAYTGIRDTDDAHPFIQSVGLAVSEDGKTFTRLADEALSEPLRDYDAIRAKGYFLGDRNDLGTIEGEDGRCAMAWRDPGLQVDPKTGLLHAFWSAKSDLREEQEAVLAHGIIHDVLTKPTLELLPPVQLPDHAEYTQAEVPQFVYNPLEEKYYMIVSTSDRKSERQIDTNLDLAVRLYSADSLSGAWKFAGKIISREDKRYPATVIDFEASENGGKLSFMAPFNRSNGEEIMHTMPPRNVAVIESGKVVKVYAPDQSPS